MPSSLFPTESSVQRHGTPQRARGRSLSPVAAETGRAVQIGVPKMLTMLGCCLIALTMSLSSGCGYMVGNGFPTEIHTIAVPVFASTSFRRDTELLLTEAVHKEIQKRTPFRLVNDGPAADTRLTGRIVDVRKDVLGESPEDDPRELQVSFAVDLLWEDLRNGRVIARERMSLPTEFVQLRSEASFAPEVGQSLATGTHEAAQRLARHVVDMMETAW